MKKVVLIGDSIRMGYQPTVVAELKGTAEISSPEENCSDSAKIVLNLTEWVINQKPDLVHINAGLHDLKQFRDADGPLHTLEQYETNLREILSRIKADTEARIIWATTTPVNEKVHSEVKGFERMEADVDRYNETALKVVREMDIPVNDLFSFVMAKGRDEMLRPDGVHFRPEAYEEIGKEVASVIGKAIDG